MFNKLLGYLVKATSVAPRYAPEHCLIVKRSVGGCQVCAESCPHDAITFDHRGITIDDIDCTGCGLCVQACPSEALSAKVSYQPGAPLRCSRVKGSAPGVHCLARLEPSDLLRLASHRPSVLLARGECASCPIGSAEVPAALDELIRQAEALAKLRGREVHFELSVAEELNLTDNPDPISRRELIRGGWRSLQGGAADVLAPLERLAKSDEDEEKPLPAELQKRYWLLKSAKLEPDAPVPWKLPRVAEGCIMCPVCTNVCPTGAFARSFDEGGAVLTLEPERCNGCNACVVSCPVRVITLDAEVTWGELAAGKQEVYHKQPSQGSVSR